MRGHRGYHVLGRRGFFACFGAALVGCGRRCATPETSSGAPEIAWGVQSGDLTPSSAVVWSRADRASAMVVEWSTAPTFDGARRVAGPRVSQDGDLVGKVALVDLPPASLVHYRVRFEGARASDWVTGRLRTPPRDDEARDVVFAWSGDVNGQGWGIDPSRGGMPAYAALDDRAVDFFVCLGDAIYADDPIPETIALPDGGQWKNLVTKAKSHVAETLDDFRGAHLYPRHSKEVRAFAARAATFSIWDDHEVRNNWFPGQVLDDPRYHEKNVDALARAARRALYEHTPTLRDPDKPMYRSFRWGSRLEVFLLDGRSYRSKNWPIEDPARFLGPEQVAWLESALVASKATWKVIACDMPVGLVVTEPAPGGQGQAWDGFANESGPPTGREAELARIFTTLAARGVENVVFLTADVHFASSIRYEPSRAQHKAMIPFWELVAGPMHAGAFGRKPLDDTFGPEVEWVNAAWDTLGSPAQPESQTFGMARIHAKTGVMTVTFVDGRGRDLHSLVLRPSA